jgi:phytoene desaturase
MNPNSNSSTISIIGSGLGGLSAAIRLACRGYDVHVYEKNSTSGGKARSVKIGGFRFDSGPSLLTMPFVIEELFQSAGEDIGNYLQIKKLDVLCKYFYPDGTVLNAYSDVDKFSEELERNTGEKSEHLHRYLEYCKRIYELTSGIFLFSDLYSPKTYANLKAFKTLFKIGKIDSFRTMDNANRSFFKDERIVQLFNRYATYNGSDPYQCPATLNIISNVEYSIGGYYINGGMIKLTDALHKLAEKKGVKFHFNSPVEEIVTAGSNVNGLMVNGEFKASDIVISNADVYNTYGKLLKDKSSKAAKKYVSLEPSSSALVFYWGVKINSPKLEAHNILFSGDYKKEFSELFEKKVLPKDPTVYIYISKKFSPGDSPVGEENWFVMINAPNSKSSNDKAQMTNKYIEPSSKKETLNGNVDLAGAKSIIIEKIKRLTGYEIRDKIVCENIMTPRDIEDQTGSFGGSIYGISSNSRKAAFLRQRNRSNKYSGLYFCGGSAHPGGGIPLVILSGKLCAEAIEK